jgi:hypothetical protein
MASNPESGIFPHLANTSAFIDKAVFSIWGDRRERILPAVEVGENRAIGGKNRMYARLIPGTCQLSGNPFELKYGKFYSWPHIPPFRLSVRSNAVPLSGAQVSATVNGLFRRGFRCEVGLVEFTFDITDPPFDYFPDHLLTRARLVFERGREGHTTVYAGGPQSSWQLRLYRKTKLLVRVEFILRLALLKAKGIERIDDLLQLRNFDIRPMASFPEFREFRLAATLARMPNCWGKNIVAESPRRRSMTFLTNVLRWRCGIDPAPLLRPSGADVGLRRMQANMFW